MVRRALTASMFLALAGCGGSARLEVVWDDCPNDDEKVEPGVCGCGIAEGRCAPLKNALVHRYAFEGSGSVAFDDVGDADGAILNTELTGLGQLYLDRTRELEQYVELPNGIIRPLASATFEAWVVWETPPAMPTPFWERIFDFGVSTAGEDQRENGKTYLFFAPGQPGTTPALPRTAYKDADSGGEVTVDGKDPCPTNTVFHAAVVVDDRAQELRLYLNAVEEGVTPLFQPLAGIDDVNNWLGRSQFKQDSRFGGSFLEFRIYDQALTQAELAASLALGPSPGFLEPRPPTAHDASGGP